MKALLTGLAAASYPQAGNRGEQEIVDQCIFTELGKMIVRPIEDKNGAESEVKGVFGLCLTVTHVPFCPIQVNEILSNGCHFN